MYRGFVLAYLGAHHRAVVSRDVLQTGDSAEHSPRVMAPEKQIALSALQIALRSI